MKALISTFAATALIVGLGIGTADAAFHSATSAGAAGGTTASPSSAAVGPAGVANSTHSGRHFELGIARSEAEGVTGDNYVIRPDCLQPNVLVQTRNGEMWERKAECAS